MTAPLIETRGLGMRFGGVHAVRDVNFTLAERGAPSCMIGPNGAGKSTFFKVLTGQLKPTSGASTSAWRKSAVQQAAEPHEIARRGVGIETQVPSVFDGLTVREKICGSPQRACIAGRRRGPLSRLCSSAWACPPSRA